MTESTAPEASRISPTAKLVAYWRQFSDIPFAPEVARLVDAESTVNGYLQGTGIEASMLNWRAPQLEARYKTIVSAIRREGIQQVLELASGVSLRGMAMTEDPAIVYVETDLPGMTAEKLHLLSRLVPAAEIKARRNLFFHAVDVLSFAQLEAATAPLSPERPIAVVHEGLFQYLSLEEKATAAQHIHKVLSRFDGVWITPDFETKQSYDSQLRYDEPMRRLTSAISGSTQRDFLEAAFDDEAHLNRFFTNLGFRIQQSLQIDGTYTLSAAQRLGVKSRILENLKSELKLWTLRVA